MIEARVMPAFQSMNLPGQRYNNEELMLKYYDLDDDFLVHSVELSISYNYNFFKVFLPKLPKPIVRENKKSKNKKTKE